MSTTAEVRLGDAPPSVVVRQFVRSLGRVKITLIAIVVAQAIWLGVLMAQGWYYQADFGNLSAANGRALSWAYLSNPQGGHFGVPTRLVFWVLNRVAPLNYPLTIGLRLIGQAAATLLLWRLLVLLFGPRRIVLVTIALYAFSPLLIQGTLWMTAALSLLTSQLFLLGALLNHVRYAVTRRIRHAVATAGFIVAAALMSEQAAVTVIVLPILSLAFLNDGDLRQRVRETLAVWREWAMIVVPMLAYVLFYFLSSKGYGDAARPLGLHHAVQVVAVEWSNTIAPGLVGGPWAWFGAGDNYLGLSTPTAPTAAVCGAGVLAVIGLSIRAQGWRALVAWSMPALVSGIGIVVVAVGRFEALGTILAQQFEHAYYTALPAAIALCAGFCRIDITAVARRVTGGADDERHASAQPPRPLVAVRASALLAVVVVLGGSIWSGVTYTQLWARSPARSYVTTLVRELDAGGTTKALYDSPVPQKILPLTPAGISAIVGLTDAHADFGYAAPRPGYVDDTGHIRAAKLYPQSSVPFTGAAFCHFPVQGATVVSRSLARPVHAGDWYLDVGYFQQYASVVTFTVIDTDGTRHSASNGHPQVLHAGLGEIHLHYPNSSPAQIRVQSMSPATNLCLTSLRVGFAYANVPAK